MLHEVFYWLLNMSIVATAVGLLIYPLRLIKHFPKFINYMLWGSVLIRLLCPVGIASDYSLLQLLSNTISRFSVRTVTIFEPKEAYLPELTMSNSLRAAQTYHPITYKNDILEGFFQTTSLLWLIGTLSALIACSIIYRLHIAELRLAIHQRDNIFISSKVSTPMVYGILKPKIVLPNGIAEEHLEYILAHERTHIRRKDNLWRIIAVLTACIHWFNPLIWLFLKCFLEDCELACDEGTIKTLHVEQRKDYARALLACNTMQRNVFTSAFGSSKIKTRISHIITYRRLTLFSGMFFTGMLLAILYIVLTNTRV